MTILFTTSKTTFKLSLVAPDPKMLSLNVQQFISLIENPPTLRYTKSTKQLLDTGFITAV